jgi:hypothetical protein
MGHRSVAEMPMIPSPVTNLMAFVPAKDSALSRQFYLNLGFTINWSNDEIAELWSSPYLNRT